MTEFWLNYVRMSGYYMLMQQFKRFCCRAYGLQTMSLFCQYIHLQCEYGARSELAMRFFPLVSIKPGRRRFPASLRTPHTGFSLVEMCIAIGVVAFAFAIIFGLLGVGLTSFRQTKNLGVTGQIAQQVFSEVENTPFNTLTNTTARSGGTVPTSVQYTHAMTVNSTSTGTLYFDEQGTELSSTTGIPAGAIYWVNIRVAYPTPILPYTAATVSSAPTGAAALNIDLATVMVQVAYNPGGSSLALDSTTSTEWTGFTQTGNIPVQIFNYQCLVPRNS